MILTDYRVVRYEKLDDGHLREFFGLRMVVRDSEEPASARPITVGTLDIVTTPSLEEMRTVLRRMLAATDNHVLDETH